MLIYLNMFVGRPLMPPVGFSYSDVLGMPPENDMMRDSTTVLS